MIKMTLRDRRFRTIRFCGAGRPQATRAFMRMKRMLRSAAAMSICA